jgi:3-methyladenine DNA glycosylase Mpg
MNNFCLMVGDQAYRIVELEIYYNDRTLHNDPYVHCAEEQLQSGNWYFNGYGIDLTFGNHEKNIHAGVLIRGLRKLDKEAHYFSGPSNVLKEIFTALGNVMSGQHGIYLQELQSGEVEEMTPVRTKRTGLTKKADDTENFVERPYRYLVELNLQHKFNDKTRVVKELFLKGEISSEEAKEIMGYNIKLEAL